MGVGMIEVLLMVAIVIPFVLVTAIAIGVFLILRQKRLTDR